MSLSDILIGAGLVLFMGCMVIEVIRRRIAWTKAKERAIYQKYYEELSPEARAEDESWLKR